MCYYLNVQFQGQRVNIVGGFARPLHIKPKVMKAKEIEHKTYNMIIVGKTVEIFFVNKPT